MKKILLTQGKFALVDNSDYQWLSQWKWCFNGAYAIRGTNKPQTFYMHRELLLPPKGMYVDHINGNKLDNRRCNLRIATPTQSNGNIRKRNGKCSSKFKGVGYYNFGGRWYWRALITINKKPMVIGYFKNEIVAVKAYRKVARTHFGEFAKF